MSDEPVVTRVATPEEAAERVAEVMATTIIAAHGVRGEAHVALSGGSNVGQAYRLLGPKLDDWSDVHLWYGDERVVPLDDPESTHRLATGTLEAPGATWHPLAVDLGCEGAAAAYADELGDTVIDFALNGMGPDGHTASLLPGEPVLQERKRWVAAVSHGRPEIRITMTYPVIESSRRVAFLLAGKEKAAMFKTIRAGGSNVPAARVKPVGELIWFVDRAAAGQG